MSSHEKPVRRFLSRPKNFTYEETTRLLMDLVMRKFPGGGDPDQQSCFTTGPTGIKSCSISLIPEMR